MRKSVFITGVSSGIGLELAREYLYRGAHVFGVSRRPTPIQHDLFRFESLDLLDDQSVPSVLQKLFGDKNRLDIAILNAGVLGHVKDIQDASIDEMKATMNTNVWANKLLLDVLLKQIDSILQIVTISSGAAIIGNRGWSGYAISKAALNMLTQLYAAENLQTHFAAMAPGQVDTAMQDYICDLPSDDRFETVETAKSRRGTAAMPKPEMARAMLVDVIDQLPILVESGQFVDVRELPEANSQPK